MRFLNLSTRLSLRRCFAAAMVWLLLAAPAIASDILFKKEIGQYRIPAIVECKSGKLIAFSDHRYDGTDIGWGHHIDIVLKASCDGGKTWSQDELMVAKGGSRIAFFSYLSLSFAIYIIKSLITISLTYKPLRLKLRRLSVRVNKPWAIWR